MSTPSNRFRPRATYTRIEGLSSTLRLPRLGKIRLGVKVKKRDRDKRCKHAEDGLCLYCTYPKDVDYFVAPPEVSAVYGEKPKELDVLIPCDDQSMFFPQSLKCYQGSRLWCKGNGKEATRINMDTGEMTERECPCEHYRGNDKPAQPVCNERANLMVLLPRVGMGGCYQVDTGSVQNIIELNSTVEWLRGMIGRVAFVPLKLKRVPTQMQVTEAGGNVRAVTKALLKLEFEGDIMRVAALRQADIISIEGGHSPKALIPPRPVEDGEDSAPGTVVVDEEPFPDEEPPAPDSTPDAVSEEGTPPPPPSAPEDGDAAATGADDPPATQAAGSTTANVDVIRAYIAGARTAGEANARWKEHVVGNDALKHEQKLNLQDVLNRRLRDLKASRR